MDEKIKTRYRETVITYNEGTNHWSFCLNGIGLSYLSLKDAKEGVDAGLLPKFPFKAYWVSTLSKMVLEAEIIGFAYPEDKFSDKLRGSSGNIVDPSYLYEITPENTIRYEQLKSRKKMLITLQQEIESITARMTKLEPINRTT